MSLGRSTARLQVGSAAWIADERAAARQLAEAEVEEFTFSARNELDWLNEHMAEIFDENQLNVTEIFKTPGKLRGKTPRTIKRNPLESRAPLSDIFSASPRQHGSPMRSGYPDLAAPQFAVAEDTKDASKTGVSPQKPAAGRNVPSMFADSGYHGSQAMSFAQTQEATQAFSQHSSPNITPMKVDSPHMSQVKSEERRETGGSFRSARGESRTQALREEAAVAPSPIRLPIHPSSPAMRSTPRSSSPKKRVVQDADIDPMDVDEVQETADIEMGPPEPVEAPEAATPSDGSSPVRQIIRKSSLSFASLPAREPLTTKKSLGARASRGSVLEAGRSSHYGQRSYHDDEDDDEKEAEAETSLASKTYTQRLQDRISMLEQAKPPPQRISKSISNAAGAAATGQPLYPTLPKERAMFSPSPSRAAPGAFPEEESFNGPSTIAAAIAPIKTYSPRHALVKSQSTDVMEDIRGKSTIGGEEFTFPIRTDKQPSPIVRKPVNPAVQRPLYGHTKSQSTSTLRSPQKDMEEFETITKTISVSNANNEHEPFSPSKSYRESPIKAAKDKLSSIIKTSKGLFASSAAISAGAMASTVPPPPSRAADNAPQPFADIVHDQKSGAQSLYPSLKKKFSSSNLFQDSPSRQASLREKKEAKEARIMEEQLGKLDKERAKEAEKARVFSQQERERVAAMERKIAAQREEERRVAAEREEERRIAMEEEQKRQLALQREQERKKAATPTIPRSARNSPRKPVDDRGESSMMPPPSLSRSQIGRPKEQVKRPLRPTSKQAAPPSRGAPVVIRVNTGSRPFQPSTAALSASLGDSLPPPAPQPAANTSRAKQPARALTSKASSDSLKSGTSTTKVRALEAAARKREQDEREAQRKRDAKIEMASQLDAKRNAQRALEKRQELEKAKLNRPPPPPVRNNPNAEREKPLPAAPQRDFEPGHKRMGSTLQRPVDENRPNNIFHQAPPKRALGYEDPHRPALQRLGSTYQENDAGKRRKTEEEFDFDPSPPRGVAAPPIRQSIARPKGLFPASGYASGQPSQPVFAQPAIPAHMQMGPKPARPMDMTQTSKAPINFAPNPAHKTPARAMGGHPQNGRSVSKQSAKSSPRYVNGELIDLPEINTDSEDDSDDGAGFAVPEWAESPNLAAGIVAQEGMDPAMVFGPPAELKMEEVFRNKERWGRFRQRTSSANWSGNDRLTEDEIQKDLAARERLRKEGGWSYGLS